MTNFEYAFIGLTFLLSLVNSIHLISKARIASIEGEIIAARAKVVADGQAFASLVSSRILALEQAIRPATSAASSSACSTTAAAQTVTAPVASPTVV